MPSGTTTMIHPSHDTITCTPISSSETTRMQPCSGKTTCTPRNSGTTTCFRVLVLKHTLPDVLVQRQALPEALLQALAQQHTLPQNVVQRHALEFWHNNIHSQKFWYSNMNSQKFWFNNMHSSPVTTTCTPSGLRVSWYEKNGTPPKQELASYNNLYTLPAKTAVHQQSWLAVASSSDSLPALPLPL